MTNDFSAIIKSGLKRRHRQEKIFKNLGIISIMLALAFLVILFTAIISKGYSAFYYYQIAFELDLSKASPIAEENDYALLIKSALKTKFPEAQSVMQKADLFSLLSRQAAWEVRDQIAKNPALIGAKHYLWLTAASDSEIYLKGKISAATPKEERKITDQQIAWIKILQSENNIRSQLRFNFFKNADSREPEIAGMAASIIGSLLTMVIFLFCAFPIGVMSAFYLEEFAPKNLLTDIIEISINNLAAIPSIIFGLLGLIVYLNFFQLTRSSSLVGGMTLSLLVLPVIIIATRNAIKSIPGSVKDAAIALGASPLQVMFHYTLPLSMPGIMTGTILAVSRALGETAPLLMIGMVAFVADVPQGFNDPATVMPVQIYLWSDSAEPGFAEKTAAAIMVLLGFLITFNAVAVYLRKKFERKW